MNKPGSISAFVAALLAAMLGLTGCVTKPGSMETRKGDEIMVAGQKFHTGTRVILWTDSGGFDAYRVERRFSRIEKSDWDTSQSEAKLTTPNRYDLRAGLTPAQIERVRGGGWDLETLQQVVDQFVIHFDACGVSATCFKILHDVRGLSVHFLLDLDGTIYQTLDLKERAWHATTSNSRSVGIEIANIGAYETADSDAFRQWYGHDAHGRTLITIPARFGTNTQHTPNFAGYPARKAPVTGELQGKMLHQYDFTPEQYAALIKLTATLCTVFPKLKCDYPHDASGKPFPRKLPDDMLAKYQGVLGHYHIQTNKVDPGPAFQWDYVIGNARRLMPPNAR